MRRMIQTALLALALVPAVGCKENKQEGPRLADPEKADPRLKAVGTGGAGAEQKGSGAANKLGGKGD